MLKTFIANLLSNNLTGRMLAFLFSDLIPCWRYGKLRFDCSSPFIQPHIKAAIFWGIYEGAEVRYIQKHLDNTLDVVELGASIGIASAYIGNQLEGKKKLYSVEANPEYAPAIESNLMLNKIWDFEIVPVAVSCGAVLHFIPGGDNTTGLLADEPTDRSWPVETQSLSKLLSDRQIEAFALVCDIEGAEADILINDPASLKNCQKIIIEVHKTRLRDIDFSISDIFGMVEGLGFHQIERHGPVGVFIKKPH